MTLKSIRLHHFPGARSARVAWLLHELGLPFETVMLRLFEGDQFEPEFLALNPGHAVPVLEFEAEGRAVTMIESGAIVAMLADLQPEARLAPNSADIVARSTYLQAIHLCAATIDMMLWQIRVHETILTPALRKPEVARQYRGKFIAEAEPRLVSALAKAPYICGTEFSAADCMIGHAVIWAQLYQLCTAPIFSDYLGRLGARPAFQRAFADTQDVSVFPETELDHLMHLFTG